MSDLRRYAEEYLALRRALGYKLVDQGRLLITFVTFAEQAGASHVTTELARRWTTLPAGASPVYLSRRMRVARTFARYLSARDPETEVPPDDLFPTCNRRPTPVLYSEQDVLALMAAARTLDHPLRAATMETFIGLLAATGMRGGEAMALDRADIGWADGVLVVRDTKFGKTREVLVHETTLDALRAYEAVRDSLCPVQHS